MSGQLRAGIRFEARMPLYDARPGKIGSGYTLWDTDGLAWRGILRGAAPVHYPDPDQDAMGWYALDIEVLDYTPIGYRPDGGAQGNQL